MRHFAFSLGILLCTSGALQAQQPQPRPPAPSAAQVSVLERTVAKYLKSFQLLDATGAALPAVLPGGATAPVAALLEFSNGAANPGEMELEIEFCTATHLRPGDVVSHISCLPHGKEKDKPSLAFLIYYDTNKQKRWFQVGPWQELTGFDAGKITIPIPREVIDAWPALLGNAFPSPDEIWKEPAKSLLTTVWAYDSLYERPDVIANLPKRNTHGMVFHPRLDCALSSQPTSLLWLSPDRQTLIEEFKIDSGDNLRNIVYFDSCSKPIIQGNLGALITRQADATHIVGIYHGILTRGTYWKQIVRATTDKDMQARLLNSGNDHFYYKAFNTKTYEHHPYLKEEADLAILYFGLPFEFLSTVFPIPDEEIPDVPNIKIRPARRARGTR